METTSMEYSLAEEHIRPGDLLVGERFPVLAEGD